jgi:integrase
VTAVLTASHLDNLFLKGEQDMARRRGQRKGYLRIEHGSWLLTYRIYQWNVEKKKNLPVRDTVTIGPGEGPGKLTEKQAQRFAHDHFLAPLDNTVLRPLSTLTFEQFWDKSYEPHKIIRKTLKLAARMQYVSLWKCWIKPVLGTVKLCELQPDHAQTLVDRILAAGRSTKTANSARIVASSIFSYAKMLRAASGDNPFGLVEMPEQQPVRPPRALTWDQCKGLLALLPSLVREMVLCAITLSMNVSELRGLRWKHVNLSPEWAPLGGDDVAPPLMIAVREHYYYRERGTLKTKNRKRNLPLPVALQAALAQLKLCSRFNSPDDPVFANQAGKPISDNNVVKRVFAKLPIELAWVTWHVFRHTHATLTKMLGASGQDRRGLMGHGSFEMLEVYTHEDYERMREIVEGLTARLLPPAAGRGTVQ